jgi:hypothetical protein
VTTTRWNSTTETTTRWNSTTETTTTTSINTSMWVYVTGFTVTSTLSAFTTTVPISITQTTTQSTTTTSTTTEIAALWSAATSDPLGTFVLITGFLAAIVAVVVFGKRHYVVAGLVVTIYFSLCAGVFHIDINRFQYTFGFFFVILGALAWWWVSRKRPAVSATNRSGS